MYHIFNFFKSRQSSTPIPQSSVTQDTQDTRFYYLSLILEENNEWSIHGFWPQYSQSKYPQFCHNVTFDPSLLDPIKQQLNEHWYSDRESNDKFWEHEWKKHGSCVFTKMNEYEYFAKTLELFQKVNGTNIIDQFKVGDTKSMIPFDLNFNLKKST